MTVFQPRWRGWAPKMPNLQTDNSHLDPPSVSFVSATDRLLQDERDHPSDGRRAGRCSSRIPELPMPRTDRTDKSPSGWDEETIALINWFSNTPPPAEPFQLYPNVWIARPERYWQALRADITAGPQGPRAHYGALQKDLRRLAVLFGGAPAPGDGGR